MTKSQLKDGMRLVLRNGHEKLYLNRGLLHFEHKYSIIISGIRLENYNDDLTNKDGDCWDVVEIYYDGKLIYSRFNNIEQGKVLSFDRFIK